MKNRWTAAAWPLLGLAIGFGLSAMPDDAAEAGPTWDAQRNAYVTESEYGLLHWQYTRDGMRVTEYYLAEYVVPAKDAKSPPTVKTGVFKRVFEAAPAKAEPTRRYGEVLRQQSAPVAPTPPGDGPAYPPPPFAPSPSCGDGGGSCG